MVNKLFWHLNQSFQLEQGLLNKGFWTWARAVKNRLPKMVKFGKRINKFYWWYIIKIIISVGKEKVQFTLYFYLKQNEEVQVDLQHFEIFLFLSILPSLPPGKMREEKLTDFCYSEYAWYAFTNNAITSEIHRIFSWNKKQWKTDKIALLMIHSFIYFTENVFPMPWYSKSSRNLVVLWFWGIFFKSHKLRRHISFKIYFHLSQVL